MPSQFFGLNIAYTGLLANNAALNTTSNNIANVQTEGYSRQQVVQQAASALQVFQTYGCAGAGVETLAIERVRDSFYDGKFWDNQANVGEYEMKQYYMKQIETYFDDTPTQPGFKTMFDRLMVTGIEELLKNPNGESEKAQFVGFASAFAEYFNGLAGNMEALQKDVNQEIKLKVDEINSLASEIAILNKQINTIELTNVNANELRDRRELLVDQLSKIVDVDITETPIVDTNNPERETGGNRYLVKIASGQVLVDGTEFRGIECVARENYEKVNQTDIDGLYEIYWEDGQKFNLYNAAMGGELQGLIQLRDGNNSENFVGEIVDIGTTNQGQQDTVTIEVSKHYLQDLNKCNLSDKGGIISLGNQQYYYDSWSYSCSYDANGEAVYSYTFTLSGSNLNDRRVTNDRVGKTAEIGEPLRYQGVPYYMSQMNEWIRTFSQKFNDILTSGFDSENRKGSIMFTANHLMDEEQFDFPDEDRYDWESYAAYQKRVQELVANGMSQADAEKAAVITVDVNDDSFYRMTASNFSVLTAMEDDASLLANRYDAGDGVEQNDLLEDLRKMVYDEDVMSFRGSNASEFLQNILADIALNTQRANTFSQTFTDISTAIDTQRMSISGVDEDEEAVNLVKYQNGYNLASKMIQVLTEVYDRLILQTGV